MKVTNVEKKEKSIVELTIQIGAEEFEAAIQKAYLKNRTKINVPGFRRGKAPRKVIEGMFGAGVFYEDAINSIYPDAYAEAVKEQGLDDVGYPNIEVTEVGKEGFTFKAKVSVRPEVKLKQYKGLVAPKTVQPVDEADIDEEMKPYINRATRLVSVEREARMGDTAVIDFEGFENGAPFEGGKGENYDLELGSGAFVPGFEDQVAGMKAGEEKDIDITFPEDYVPQLAGKAVVFHVKVKEVKEHQAPTVDDEFAKDVSEFETLAEFREDLGKKLADRREKQAQSAFESGVMEALIGELEADIPEGMVDVQVDRLMEDYAYRLRSQGMDFDKYMEMMGTTPEIMRGSARPSALRQVQMELALTAVADAEGIEVTEEEFEAEYSRLAAQYNMPVEQVKAAVAKEDMRRDLRLQKANKLVVDEAVVGEPAPKEEPAAEEAKEEPAAE